MGRSHAASVIAGDDPSRAIVVLTDRNVYLKGKLTERVGRRLISDYGRTVIRLGDVRQVTWKVRHHPLIAALAGVLLFIGFRWSCGELQPGGGWLLAPGVALLAVYLATRRRFLLIEHRHGAIGADCRSFAAHEIQEFTRKL
jgi:hypothetical protein